MWKFSLKIPNSQENIKNFSHAGINTYNRNICKLGTKPFSISSRMNIEDSWEIRNWTESKIQWLPQENSTDSKQKFLINSKNSQNFIDISNSWVSIEFDEQTLNINFLHQKSSTNTVKILGSLLNNQL